MTDFQAQVQQLVEQFVANVTDVARKSALERLTSALGASPAKRTRRRRGAR